MSQENNVVMVRADSEVADVLTSAAKLIGAAAQAKSLGVTVGTVRAMHAQRIGASGAVAASLTGKNRAGVIHATAQAVMSRIVAHDGAIDYARAMTEVCGVLSAQVAYTYPETVRADGARVVKRAVWLQLGEDLRSYAREVGKTDKPTPRAKCAIDAMAVYKAIADRAEALRTAAETVRESARISSN